MKMWPFLYSLQFETGVIRAGVNGAGVKKGPALKGPIRYIYIYMYISQKKLVKSRNHFYSNVSIYTKIILLGRFAI